ncbi:MAG TPA: hypothetical protein VLI92_00365 [Candidatus Saccharimonadales bacterium]|nr:hypothetical protein [Candidatus Saccharimonadales bacterium]
MLTDLTVTKVKPSQIDTSKLFVGTNFRRTELELVARNIVIMCTQCDDTWIEFDCQFYKKYFGRQHDDFVCGELEMLEHSINALTRTNGKYKVNDTFIRNLSEYIHI